MYKLFFLINFFFFISFFLLKTSTHNNILKKTKVTFSQSAPLRYFNDLKYSLIESELKLVVISLSMKINSITCNIENIQVGPSTWFFTKKDSIVSNMQYLLVTNIQRRV